MALDKQYFDAISIETVKKKYYNANKVKAVFQDIEQQALALNDENASLRQELAALSSQKEDIGNAVLNAGQVAQIIVREAQEKAERLLAAAKERCIAFEKETRQRCDDMLAEAEQAKAEANAEALARQDYAITRFEACYTRMKSMQEQCIEALNDEWREFLCGLYTEEPEEPSVPADLGDKVQAILCGIKAVDEEE